MALKLLAIEMEDVHREYYEKLSKQQKIGRASYLRIRILLMCEKGVSNYRISKELKMSVNTVKKWRDKWIDCHVSLEGISGKEMEAILERIISDAPREGCPKKFQMHQEKAIVALACGLPRDHGIEMTDWTLEMLARVSKSQGIVESISTSQLSRLLKNRGVTTA